jgi:hypothetical protein
LKTTQQCLTEHKKSLKKATTKNDELEDKIFQLNQECVDVQSHN